MRTILIVALSLFYTAATAATSVPVLDDDQEVESRPIVIVQSQGL